MTGNTITQSLPPTSTAAATSAHPVVATSAHPVVATAASSALAQSRAARELELKRGEFDLAVRLGCIRTVPDEGGGGRRVARAEIDRVRSESGFPDALRARVKAVGTSEGAALMDVTAARFTRFARLGFLVPVKFYLNRYRAVVWLYLAEELRQFAESTKNAPLLSGRTPEVLRDQLDAGLDLRARNWRGRHMGFLLRQTEDPWARAAAVASLLDPIQVAEIVADPYERAYMNRFRPEQVTHAVPDSPAAAVAARIMTAEDPDEISWLRSDLGNALEEARENRPAPRPAPPSRTPARSTEARLPTAAPQSTTAGRQTAGPRPTDALQSTGLWQLAEARQLGEVRQLAEVRHQAETRQPTGTLQPIEARQSTEKRQSPDVRRAIDERDRPGRLRRWLRRRNA